jgi:hypothetical protein
MAGRAVPRCTVHVDMHCTTPYSPCGDTWYHAAQRMWTRIVPHCTAHVDTHGSTTTANVLGKGCNTRDGAAGRAALGYSHYTHPGGWQGQMEASLGLDIGSLPRSGGDTGDQSRTVGTWRVTWGACGQDLSSGNPLSSVHPEIIRLLLNRSRNGTKQRFLGFCLDASSTCRECVP